MKIAAAVGAFSRELVSVMERAVSPRYGLIERIVEEPPAREGLGIRLAHAVIAPPAYFRANRRSTVRTVERGTGAAFARQPACWAAIGEALERYAASIYWPDQLVMATARSLNEPILDLARLIRPGRSDVQAFCAESPRAWTRGVDLMHGHTVMVPAAMTWLGYVPAGDGEVICQNDSTGLACGNTTEGACLSALCEMIERDVFASFWLLQRKPPRLDTATALSRLDLAVRRALASDRLSVRLYHLARTCGVHVVMSVITSQAGHGVVSAAASPSIIRAVEKAVCEGLYSWTASGRDMSRIQDARDIRQPSDHLVYYRPPERFRIVEALLDSPDRVVLDDLIRDPVPALRDIVAALNSEGFSPAMVNVTTADVEALEMQVVRVVVPGLQPLVFGADCVRVPDRRRVAQWRQAWSLSDGPLNPLPHPFP